MGKAFFPFLVFWCLFLAGCEDTDIIMAAQAGIEAVRAATLGDDEVKRLGAEVARQSDLKHVMARPGSPQAKRLQKLVSKHGNIDGYTFDCKVYLSPEINAFAMANGSIRIYSGLMDKMNDGELLFVVGHEMGHVVEKHIKKKIRLAYAGRAVRKAIASQQSEVGQIARSDLGAFAEILLNAQFSQQEERKADDYGVTFIKGAGYDVQPAISALMKLAALGNGHTFLSSHPAPEARAKRLRENTLSPGQTKPPHLLDRVVAWLKSLSPFEKNKPAGLSWESI